MRATILWIDDRTKYYEGQALASNGLKYYFNYSTCIGKPCQGQWVTMTIDTGTRAQCAFITELFNLKFKGGSNA